MNQSSNARKLSTLNRDTDITRCAAYIRTEIRGEADDCPVVALQKDRMETYASEKGWTICKWYKDNGFSGLTVKRPALKHLMADAEKHCFDRVLVFQIDRLALRIADFSTIVTKLAGLSIEVASVTPAFDTASPAGRLTCGVFAALAEWEKNISLVGDEPLECSLLLRNFDATPATRLVGNAMCALLQFQSEQGDEDMARSELLLHSADLQRKGAQ